MSKPKQKNKWEIYEDEKRRLQVSNLPPQLYEKAIVDLCKKLGI